MKVSINIKTVAAMIDATATVEKKVVGIRYITGEGFLREMKVSKRVSRTRKKRSGKHHRATPNSKMKGLIQITDHTQGEEVPKTLFLYGIIGFNPDGNLDNFIDVL